MFGPEYPKIQTVFKRDERNLIIPDDYSTPEIAYLANLSWSWTEKVDGTNIRLHWNGRQLTIGGRTDEAQVPSFLVAIIQGWQLEDRLFVAFGDNPETNVTLYGEGYGSKIQKGGQYRADPSFILFDIMVVDEDGHEWWLSRENVYDVANKTGLDVIPNIGVFSLAAAVELVRDRRITSNWPNARIEGLVGRLDVDLFNRKGERIMVKVKDKDFRDLERRK